MPTFSDVIAVPGADHIIDVINPDTDRTAINGHTLEEVQAREPGAVRMPWSEYQTAKIARQNTPIRWTETTEARYHEMLEVLPPIDWTGGAFLVGEPSDHSAETGQPRYQAYRTIGSAYPQYFASSRPVTRAELRAALQGGAR